MRTTRVPLEIALMGGQGRGEVKIVTGRTPIHAVKRTGAQTNRRKRTDKQKCDNGKKPKRTHTYAVKRTGA